MNFNGAGKWPAGNDGRTLRTPTVEWNGNGEILVVRSRGTSGRRPHGLPVNLGGCAL